tara:strand:- start:293 stop:394 length:102 start_codon:yes stop_codon:yes gene_type:complete
VAAVVEDIITIHNNLVLMVDPVEEAVVQNLDEV